MALGDAHNTVTRTVKHARKGLFSVCLIISQ
nr:MAG TPA_asm: hypothetical protein [Caudoviricetes sp.]